MLHVLQNFAKSLKITWNYNSEYGMCKFLLVFYCNYVSILYHFSDIQHSTWILG